MQRSHVSALLLDYGHDEFQILGDILNIFKAVKMNTQSSSNTPHVWFSDNAHSKKINEE